MRTIATLLAACSIQSCFFGCAAPKPPPELSTLPYSGPALKLVDEAGQHVVRFESPSPGWEPILDQTREDWRHMGAYVTLMRPDPAFVYPQVITGQDVATGVASNMPIRVYVRVADFVPANKRDTLSRQPYHLSTSYSPTKAANP